MKLIISSILLFIGCIMEGFLLGNNGVEMNAKNVFLYVGVCLALIIGGIFMGWWIAKTQQLAERGGEMKPKSKAGILSTLIGMIFTTILWILVLQHIKATPVIWLIFWLIVPVKCITTLLIKWIYEIDEDT